MITPISFEKEVFELVKEVSVRRDQIREDFVRAYLSTIEIEDAFQFSEILKKLELVEQWSPDRMAVSWHFRVFK